MTSLIHTFQFITHTKCHNKCSNIRIKGETVWLNIDVFKKSKQTEKKRRLLHIFLLPILILGLSATAYGSYLFVKAKTVASDSYEGLGDRDNSPMRDRKIDPKKMIYPFYLWA